MPHDEPLLGRAREALAAVTTIVPHTDADGLAAGAIALRARGLTADDALLLGRGRDPWTEALPAGPPALLDWGVRTLAGPGADRRPSRARRGSVPRPGRRVGVRRGA